MLERILFDNIAVCINNDFIDFCNKLLELEKEVDCPKCIAFECTEHKDRVCPCIKCKGTGIKKPNEGSRLLTERELAPLVGSPEEITKAQRDLTASIMDAFWWERIQHITKLKDKECQARIEALIEEIGKMTWRLLKYGANSSSNSYNQALEDVRSGIEALKATHLKGDEG